VNLSYPELPLVVVCFLVLVLLDRYRAVRRLVTGGRTRRLGGGRANAADADTAANEQADQKCPNLHCGPPGGQSTATKISATAKHRVGFPFERSVFGKPGLEFSRTVLVAAGCMTLAAFSAGSGLTFVADSFGLDFELEPDAGAAAAAARAAELFLARRRQALSSAQARFVSGE